MRARGVFLLLFSYLVISVPIGIIVTINCAEFLVSYIMIAVLISVGFYFLIRYLLSKSQIVVSKRSLIRRYPLRIEGYWLSSHCGYTVFKYLVINDDKVVEERFCRKFVTKNLPNNKRPFVDEVLVEKEYKTKASNFFLKGFSEQISEFHMSKEKTGSQKYISLEIA